MGRKGGRVVRNMYKGHMDKTKACLLYTSDAADDWLVV